ncbi:DUF2637 domain-containing protein [Actinacidiphila bryophytorum]|uniref:DUF2637 domain-containing protein n=1 Tax=Actinacidiphila bryophytorum TaxID=1436133 RepID=A0A9W4H1M2_9ACTN|nr:DUF2637 domain-containing protein [Actinacidiphila bryophytorum]MBM9435144.1 DUF2637 domain-containing protein [Actinacidiphila bryophytorum]MBN6541524.1 DUF2637 domain-containing protein [Actinacidiphila bryophytorum]CAG7643401.1 conserved membrane hypothetical protein [Actinacidiphila bryophytorum]
MSTSVSPTPSAPIPERTRRRRARPLDSLAILLLGGSACTLSFDALRQVALASHVRPVLAYLFPIIIDGFIGYGVRAILLLRDAPPSARRYAWTLFAAASSASLWANALHAIRLNSPGTHILVLGNAPVGVLSTIAPLALGGATHLHILVTRHAPSPESAPAGTPGPGPAVTEQVPAAASPAPSGKAPAETSGRKAAPTRRTAPSRPRTRTGTGRPGRRADASIDELATVIATAYPDSAQVSRAEAREAIQAAGLSAGNDRVAQAVARLAESRSEQAQLPTA